MPLRGVSGPKRLSRLGGRALEPLFGFSRVGLRALVLPIQWDVSLCRSRILGRSCNVFCGRFFGSLAMHVIAGPAESPCALDDPAGADR